MEPSEVTPTMLPVQRQDRILAEVERSGGARIVQLAERHALHAAIIDAVETRDRDRALALIRQHNTPGTPGSAPGGG